MSKISVTCFAIKLRKTPLLLSNQIMLQLHLHVSTYAYYNFSIADVFLTQRLKIQQGVPSLWWRILRRRHKILEKLCIVSNLKYVLYIVKKKSWIGYLKRVSAVGITQGNRVWQ